MNAKAKVQYRVCYNYQNATGLTSGVSFVDATSEEGAREEFSRLNPGYKIESVKTEADREFHPIEAVKP